ncbi:MAG: DUF559 domain-containing protein [Candidatus Kapaibacterium sp.]|nr:DUF559 domain-containing protein [Bacteroidota bacterium]
MKEPLVPYHGNTYKVPEYLLENARSLRERETNAEHLLWKLLRNRQILHAKFRRQHPIDRFILDFYCHDAELSIELDGSTHLSVEQKQHDKQRTEYLNSIGIYEMRFWNSEVLNNIDSVLEQIGSELQRRLR